MENLDSYDIIFLGYPNWNADLPMPLYTLLEQTDLSGKTIVPFTTHGGSGFSRTIQTIQELQPNQQIKKEWRQNTMTIGEICQKLSLSETTLRYYERQGVLYRIPRIGGRRDYSEKDYHRLQEILQLRRAGVPLKTICDYFALVDQGGQTAELRRAMLLEQRNAMVKQIADMQKNVCALDNILDSAFPPLLYENEKQAAGL